MAPLVRTPFAAGRPDPKVLVHVSPERLPMHYSICFKNDHGHTQRSEYTRFKTDADAIGYGRRSTREAAMIEVWKGDHLLVRLEQKEPVAPSVAN